MDPSCIQKGMRAMQNGVANKFTAVATVVSDTANGCNAYRLTITNPKMSIGVLRPGTGKIPNQNPNNKRTILSVQVISCSGVTR